MKNAEKSYILAIKRKDELPESESECRDRIKHGIEALVIDGVRKFVCVTDAEGVKVAECICDVKKEYPEVGFDIIIPYEEIFADWSEALSDRFFAVAEKCDNESFFERRYSGGLYEKLIGSMINEADSVVAVLV